MMRSAPVLVVIGAVVGAATSFLLMPETGNETTGARNGTSLLERIETRIGRNRDSMQHRPDVAERLVTYRQAAQQTDPEAISDRLAEIAARGWSPASAVEIDALLVRLSELSPAYAAEVAARLALEPHFLAEAFQRWAAADPAAALAGLAGIDGPTDRRQIALALLAVLGDDEESADRVAAALPPSERDPFRIEWLGRRAATDPIGAFGISARIGETLLKQRALQTVARAWARQDPGAALQQADLLSGDLARSFRSTVASEWARFDADGFLSYFESQVSPADEVALALRIALVSDPERAMRLADGLTGMAGQMIRSAAFTTLAESDPDEAMARASRMQPGQDRNQLLQAIGSVLARQDPKAAIDWARELSPPAPEVLRSVAMVLAETDSEAAFDLIDGQGFGIESQLVYSMIASQASNNSETARRLANSLRARRDMQSAAALRNVVSSWMQQDAEQALDWVLTNGADIDSGVIASAAQVLAQQDPVAAAGYIDRIPPQFTPVWIAQVAAAYGQYDPTGAIDWILQFQGQEGYAAAVDQLLISASRTDPRAAAQLLLQAGTELQPASAMNVAMQLAQQAPREAADWALRLDDEAIRNNAVRNVVGTWANVDATAAGSWVLRLQEGELRDQALSNLLVSQAQQTGELDDRLFEAISNDNVRNGALEMAVGLLARRDPARARQLVEQEAADPAQRRRLEQQIERTEQTLRSLF